MDTFWNCIYQVYAYVTTQDFFEGEHMYTSVETIGIKHHPFVIVTACITTTLVLGNTIPHYWRVSKNIFPVPACMLSVHTVRSVVGQACFNRLTSMLVPRTTATMLGHWVAVALMTLSFSNEACVWRYLFLWPRVKSILWRYVKMHAARIATLNGTDRSTELEKKEGKNGSQRFRMETIVCWDS